MKLHNKSRLSMSTQDNTHTHIYHTRLYRYHSPTAYSAVSMSPIELTFLNVAIIVPLFLVPINGIVFVAVVVYIYYFGLMDHSGIMMESWFPWQPHTKFHDDHHRYGKGSHRGWPVIAYMTSDKGHSERGQTSQQRTH